MIKILTNNGILEFRKEENMIEKIKKMETTKEWQKEYRFRERRLRKCRLTGRLLINGA